MSSASVCRFSSATVERMRAALAWLPISTMLACTGPAAKPPHASIPRAPLAATAAESLPSTQADALFSSGQRLVVTGWESAPERLGAGYCRGCHEGAHAAWSTGMHALAWSDPVFEAALRLEPKAWCSHCHAPLLAQHSGGVAPAEGINCAACHVRAGAIVGERAVSATIRGHAVRAVAGFAGAELCAGCHQFQFPHASSAAMQNTLAEWRASNEGPCRTCHFDGHRSRGPHDPTWLSRLVRGVELETLDDGLSSVRVELAARGHSLPTGDLFHSFVLEVATNPDFEPLLASARYGREFRTEFTPDQRVSTRVLLRDTSVPASSPALTLTFDTPMQTRLFGRLRYFLHDSVLNHASSRDSSNASTVWSAALELPTPRASRKD